MLVRGDPSEPSDGLRLYGPVRRVLVVCRFATPALVALSAAISVAVLVGWTFDIVLLKSIVPGLVAMNPLTSVCFLACAVSLECLRRESSPPLLCTAGVACAAVVTVAALARLVAYATGSHFSADQIVFADRLAAAATPNQMAPNTALNFILFGGALLLLRLPRGIRPAQLMAVAVALTAFVALVGYVFSVSSFIRIATYIPMALHTAFNFLCLASAMLCAKPELGIMLRITRDSPGGRLLRGMIPAFVFFPTAFGWLRIQGEVLGLYSAAFGAAIMVGAIVALGVVLVWTNAASMDRIDEERVRVEQATRRLAYFDGLTGLPNRFLFADRLGNALARSRRDGGYVVVLFLDLDGFKEVNDRFGHDTGDALLRQVADRLRRCVRGNDTCARLAGDEFSATLVGIQNIEQVDIVPRRMLGVLSKPYEIDGHVVHVSASIGVCVSPPDTGDVQELIKKSDLAMYSAKRAGRNRFARYEPAMEAVGPRVAAGTEIDLSMAPTQ